MSWRTPWESNPAFCPLNRRMPTPVRRGVQDGSDGRNRTFARLIQSQSGSPERARMAAPADGLEPSSTASKTVLPPRPTGTSRISARRGDRTHLSQIKNLLPHQSAWRAFSLRRLFSFQSGHYPAVMPYSWVARESNDPFRAAGGNRTRHSDLASRRVTLNTSTAEDTRVP